MYTIDDLNVRLLSELKEIAEGMGIKNAKKLSKQDLIYKILDQQAVSPETAPAKKPAVTAATTSENDSERKMRPRRRENVAPATPKAETEFTSDELLDSLNLDFGAPAPDFNNNDDNIDNEPIINEERPPRQVPIEAREERSPQQIARAIREFDGAISNEGVLEIMQDGYGFLRSSGLQLPCKPR